MNGNRVELAEVEVALGASLLVDAAAAKLDTHKQRLVAFVVLRPEVLFLPPSLGAHYRHMTESLGELNASSMPAN